MEKGARRKRVRVENIKIKHFGMDQMNEIISEEELIIFGQK